MNVASLVGFLRLGGLELATENRDDSYHFLVFTDLFGNRTHGVVAQFYRAIQVQIQKHA